MNKNHSSTSDPTRPDKALLEAIVEAKVEAAQKRRSDRLADGPCAPDAPASRYGAASVLGFIGLADDSEGAFVSAVADAWAEDIEAEKAIVSDDNIEAAWAASETVSRDGYVEIVDLT